MTATTIPDTALINNVDPIWEAPHNGALPQEPGLAGTSSGPPAWPSRPEHYQRIWLAGTETTAELRARGVPARTARTTVTRGWYIQNQHSQQYPQDEGPGLFASFQNPYAFATAQVRHVLREQAWRDVAPEDLEDAVQDALLGDFSK